MFELLLALPRQMMALMLRNKRLRQFEQLKFADLPCEASGSAATTVLDQQVADRQDSDQAQSKPPHIMISCGDVSGESHALRLVEHLRERYPDLHISGFAGTRLQAAGMDVWQPLADLNVMGFKDVLAQLPLFFGCVARFAREINQNRPDAVVLVDYPGLNRHLLRIAARAGVPVIDFIAPQLWAWAPWRIRDFRKADELLTILPFEKDWFEKHGAQASYIGHPLGDGLHQLADGESEPPPEWQPCGDHGSDPNGNDPNDRAPNNPNSEQAHWVGILPGSRRREIEENLPVLLAAAVELQKRQPQVRFVLPHLRDSVRESVQQHLASADVEVLYAHGCFHRILPDLRAAWVASGTALLEVAAYNVPPVLVYGVSSRMGAWLSEHWLAVPWVGSLNLLAGEELAPEHLGRNLDPIALADDLEARLHGPERDRILAEISRLRPAFAESGACRRGADRVAAYLG
jgi:lipid-A-disaccharide synthase